MIDVADVTGRFHTGDIEVSADFLVEHLRTADSASGKLSVLHPFWLGNYAWCLLRRTKSKPTNAEPNNQIAPGS